MTNIEQTFKEEVQRLLPGVKNHGANYQFSFEKLNYGYVVSVGCKKFAVETRERVEELMKVYLDILESLDDSISLDDLWYRYFYNSEVQMSPEAQIEQVGIN